MNLIKLNKIFNLYCNNYLNKNIYNFKKVLYQYDNNDWKKYAKTDIKNYKKNLISSIPLKSERYEIILFGWLPGQITELTSYNKYGCLYKVLENKLLETVYKNNHIFCKKIYNKNEISYIDFTYGDNIIENNTNEISYSLHLFGPKDNLNENYKKNFNFITNNNNNQYLFYEKSKYFVVP